MPESYDSSLALRNKSLALVWRTRHCLQEVDAVAFPTPHSAAARDLLLSALEKLEAPAALEAMDPQVLYKRLLELQELVGDVLSSSAEHISWPLVSYCDTLWQALFPVGGPRVFYSLTSEYNYGILNYSERLAGLLGPLLPASEVGALVGRAPLYCLRLASLEDATLPLYANIGHELGHALYDQHREDLKRVVVKSLNQVVDRLLAASGTPDDRQRETVTDLTLIVLHLARELFADLVGVLLIGPAFHLSLYEMTWGTGWHDWTIRVSPHPQDCAAYPSPAFRLSCLKLLAEAMPIRPGEGVRLSLPGGALASSYEALCGLPTDSAVDTVLITEDAHANGQALERAFAEEMPSLQETLRRFLRECRTGILDRFADRFAAVEVRECEELLLRLQHDLPPNIVPDGSLLGTPARFQPILAAAALYRLHLLQSFGDSPTSAAAGQALEKVSRLTSKALEVSYVQQQYNAQRGRS